MKWIWDTYGAPCIEPGENNQGFQLAELYRSTRSEFL